ncbi:MAG TPA: crotonase/enoyl-CoA hydratase family protein [Actinomycetota bacterium]|nr:crotonase/enoyl-CoA hydratase family protein [Actinomycetota bacterium]
MTYEQISYDVSDGVATVTLDRPEKLNAFTRTMLYELLDVFDRIDGDDGVRAVVVTGRGRAFCAGADLSGGGGTFDRDRLGEPSDETLRDGGGRVTLRVFDCRKPVIAAINGPAVGVGITMTLPMDVRLAVPDAKIGFVFTRRGIVPEAASSWFLPRLVGISTAVEWGFTGRIFTGAEAHERGLVRSLHSPEELLPAAYALAREIADNTSAVSIALTRQMFWRMLGAPHPMSAHIADSRAMYEMGRGPDAAEGVTSFLEKRPPNFPLKVSTDLPDLGWEQPSFEWSGPR